MAEDAGLPLDTTTAEPELSLAEHEAQFSRGGSAVAESESTEAAREPAGEASPEAAEPARDTKGRFQPKDRRPRSHQAGPEDVPRIQELTKRLRDAEKERDEWKSKASPAPESAAPVAAAPAAPPQSAARPTAPPALRKPLATDTNPDGTPKYATYEDFLDARDEYNKQTWREEQRQERAQEAAAQRVSAAWNAKVDAAKKKYDNFESVALLKPTRIPSGSLLDAWILEDEAGADVLMHFQQDDAELDRVLALPPFAQVKYLSLLSQRLTESSSRPQSAPTGAAERAPASTVARPPTPVRTTPQRAADEPPDDENASLAEHEKFYHRSRDRRR